MSKVIYAKFNKTRAPRFQTCTRIIDDSGKLYVEKTPVTSEAESHIDSFEGRAQALTALYAEVRPCQVQVSGHKAVFPYVQGRSVAELIESRFSADVESVMNLMKKFMGRIFSYREGMVAEFYYTDAFRSVYGDEPGMEGVPAVQGTDTDTIFDNYITDGDSIISIDYEWFFDFPIPVDFLKFRTLYYFYSKNSSYFSSRISLDDYMNFFDQDPGKKDRLLRMDDHFQQYVHGENRKYIYPWKYQQPEWNTRNFLDATDDAEGKIIDLNQRLSNTARQLDEASKQISSVNGQLAAANNRLNETVIAMDRLMADHNAVMNSLSWRITAPFRGIVLACYKLVKHFKWTSVCYDGARYFFKFGPVSTYRRIQELYGRPNPVIEADQFELTDEEVKREESEVFHYMPRVSVLVPLYNTPENFLREMIESVQTQTYQNWELCLADGSDDEHRFVGDICREYSDNDSRILYKKLSENRGISDNTNECLAMAGGELISLFDHDDLLVRNTLYEVVKKFNEDERIGAVYTDEDKYLYDSKTGKGKYVEPHYKSNYNLDLLRSNNYICHFFTVKKSIVDRVGGFRHEYDGSQDFDFILRCTEQAEITAHIPRILYHWRIHSNSTAADPSSKMYCYEAGQKAVQSHLKRVGVEGTVEMLPYLGFYRVRYPVKGNPFVSIIIPNKDQKETLKKCIDSILNLSTYNNIEIIIVENNSTTDEIFDYYNELKSDDRINVVKYDGDFNYSRINNYGVSYAHGDYILLLNNDVEVITRDWIEIMLSSCERPEVGIVGAKLLYPDNTIQHCGVIIGLGGIAGHAFSCMDGNIPGYFGRAVVQQNLSAVTAACLMVKRSVYEEVNGLEEQLQVAFNDVDFCLKVRKAGYLVVLDPNAKLHHYESKSRGAEDTPEKQARFNSEVKYMAEHWKEILSSGDPYYNPNLTLIRGDFSPMAKGENPPMYC